MGRISKHSGAKVVVLEDQHCLQKYQQIADEVKDIQTIVIWNPTGVEDGCVLPGGQRVVSWDKFLVEGENSSENLDARISMIKPGHCCALIYTSGTTGMPKAVMVSHDNIYFEANTVMTLIGDVVGNGKDIDGNDCMEERLISYLPLSHVAGMMVDIICPVALTANPCNGSYTCVAFARPYDLKVGTLSTTLKAVQPTMFIGVPRVWEKISEAMKAIGASLDGIVKKISTWGKAKGLKHSRNMEMGGTGAYPCCHGLASKLVHSKVKTNLGLDKCKFGFTGAAPIMVDTLEYFGQLGIQINEVYGMSECTGAVTWSTDHAHKWGSCGFAMPGMECVVMDPDTKTVCPPAKDPKNPTEPEQGELCYRGRNIMMGYLANPELGTDHVAEIGRKTGEAIDSEGWLHSGDKGCMDSEGMFRITGRYKELIIGAGGENVAPVPMENFLKTNGFGISDAMMVGDRQKYNVCLVTLEAEGHTGDLRGGDQLSGAALKVSSAAATISAAKTDAAWQAQLDRAKAAVNKTCASNAAKIQKFAIVDNFSVESGEFTPTLKLKRSVVEKQYTDVIRGLYGSDYVEKKK